MFRCTVDRLATAQVPLCIRLPLSSHFELCRNHDLKKSRVALSQFMLPFADSRSDCAPLLHIGCRTLARMPGQSTLRHDSVGRIIGYDECNHAPWWETWSSCPTQRCETGQLHSRSLRGSDARGRCLTTVRTAVSIV